MKNATDVSASVQGRAPERGPALEAGAVLIGGRNTLRSLSIGCLSMGPAYIFAGCSSHAAAVTLRELQSPALVSPLSGVGGLTAEVGVAALARANTASSRRHMRRCMYSHGSASISSNKLSITPQIRVHRLLSGSFIELPSRVLSVTALARPTKPVAAVTEIEGFFSTVGSFEAVRAIF